MSPSRVPNSRQWDKDWDAEGNPREYWRESLVLRQRSEGSQYRVHFQGSFCYRQLGSILLKELQETVQNLPLRYTSLKAEGCSPGTPSLCYVETKKKLSCSNTGHECWGDEGGAPTPSAAPRTAQQWLSLALGDRISLPSCDHTVVIIEGPTASSIWERPVSPAALCGTKVQSCGVTVGQHISGLGFIPVSPSLQGTVILQ